VMLCLGSPLVTHLRLTLAPATLTPTPASQARTQHLVPTPASQAPSQHFVRTPTPASWAKGRQQQPRPQAAESEAVVAGAVLCRNAHRPAVSCVYPATSRRRRAFAAAVLAGSSCSCIVPSPSYTQHSCVADAARRRRHSRLADSQPLQCWGNLRHAARRAPLRVGLRCSAALWDNAAMCVDAMRHT